MKTTVKGFQNAGPGSVITVKGKVKGKGKSMRVQATGIYVG